MTVFSLFKNIKSKIFRKKPITKSLPTEPIMLLDFYIKTLATVGGNGHFELVVSTTDNSKRVLLERYIKESEAESEVKTSFLVPAVLVRDVFDIIKEKRIFKWNDQNITAGLDGEKIVFKFRNGKSYTRVCSDALPPDGLDILKSIQQILQSYLKEEYLI